MEWYPLDGDQGLVPNVFHHLWRKNASGQSCPNVVIPDTIIFRLNRPSVWYFTSKSGGILRKTNTTLTDQDAILRTFAARSSSSKCEACAVFISCIPAPHGIAVVVVHALLDLFSCSLRRAVVSPSSLTRACLAIALCQMPPKL